MVILDRPLNTERVLYLCQGICYNSGKGSARCLTEGRTQWYTSLQTCFFPWNDSHALDKKIEIADIWGNSVPGRVWEAVRYGPDIPWPHPGKITEGSTGMISKKGKRKLEFQGNTYYWHIKEDRDKNPRIHISSEDKSFYLTCGFDREIGVGTRHIKALLSGFLADKGERTSSRPWRQRAGTCLCGRDWRLWWSEPDRTGFH